MRYHEAVRWLWTLLLVSCLVACGGEEAPVQDATPSSLPTPSSDALSAHDGALGDDTAIPEARDTAWVEEVESGEDRALEEVAVPLQDSEAPEDLGPIELDDAEVAGDAEEAEEIAEDEDAQDATVASDGASTEELPEPGLQPVPEGASPGRAPMRRLTRHELDNTLRDLSGVSGVAQGTLPPEPETQGFDNHVDAQAVSPSFVEALMLTAEQVAAAVDLAALLPCDPESEGESVCGHAFVSHLGRLAMRRPLSEPQRLRFEALFDSSLDAWGFDEAARLVLTAMLMSPHFVYRVELGLPETASEGVVRPTPHEMAQRLSYLLYESMPDAELSMAADKGELVSAASVLEQAERMLSAQGSREMFDHFHRQWLLLDRLLFMAPVSDKFASFRTETRLFVERTLFEGEGSFSALMTSPETFADGLVALVYGQPDLGAPVDSWISEAQGFQAVSLDPARRAGVLTHPSVLSVNAVGPSAAKTLIRRGVFVLDRILCSPLPPPSDEVPQLPLDDETELSPPDLLAQHTSDPACSGCHGVIDPVGKAFEHYGAVGAWRDVYHDGTEVDAQTEFVGTPVDGGYADAVELAHALAESEVAERCYTRHWYRFAHGRAVEEDDAQAFEAVLEAFASADGDVRTLVETLVTTDAFLYRPWTPAEGGGEP